MSLQVEKLEKNMAKLTVEVSAEQFDACIQTAYKKNKNRFVIPGFRKGKAPLNMIEKMYGAAVFYEDAADEAINNTYADAMKEERTGDRIQTGDFRREDREGPALRLFCYGCSKAGSYPGPV